MVTQHFSDAPWSRQTGETAAAYEKFSHYVAQGPARSLRSVATETGSRLSLLKRWSASKAWVERAAAFDAHAIERGLSRRRQQIELSRQRAVDLLNENVEALQMLARGQLPPGDQEPILDRHGSPCTRQTVDAATGEHRQEVLTRSAVTPQVRVRALMDLIALGGLAPLKGDVSLGEQSAHLQKEMAGQLQGFPPAVVEILVALLGLGAQTRLERLLYGWPVDQAVGKTHDHQAVARLRVEADELSRILDRGELPRTLGVLTEIKWRVWDLVAEIDPDFRFKNGPPEYTRDQEFTRDAPALPAPDTK